MNQLIMKLFITILAFLMFQLPGAARAEIPQVICYQGRVMDAGGGPVPNGDYSMEFDLYDELAAGTLLWSSGTQMVSLEDGIFSVLLGDVGQPVLNLEFDRNYWLQITVEGSVQNPRTRMASVGYAYMSSGLVAGTEIRESITSGTFSALKVVNTSTSGFTYGLHGESHSIEGCGVYGYATATEGETYGGRFENASNSGWGVYCIATATTGQTHGVYGQCNSSEGYAIYGENVSSGGSGDGVYGSTYSFYGSGVYGRSGSTLGYAVGVHGVSDGNEGTGVYGYASSTGPNNGVWGHSISPQGGGVLGTVSSGSGVTFGVGGAVDSPDGFGVWGRGPMGAVLGEVYQPESIGIRGESYGDDGIGVYGFSSGYSTVFGFTCGVYGEVQDGDGKGVFGAGPAYGVVGRADGTSARAVSGYVSAETGTTYGGRFTSASQVGIGVSGVAANHFGATIGVEGESRSPAGRGVLGVATNTTGNGQGVRGESDSSTNGVGVYGLGSSTTGLNYGVFGRSHSPTGYGVYYAGGLAGSGTKSCVVRTSKGPTLMYCQESPENWFEDFGEGQLVSGRCHIELDHIFLETVTIDEQNPMKVFIQLRDECEGVYVKTTNTAFDVVELHGGQSDAALAYRVVAKRRGFEQKRLDYCAAAENDPYLFPELAEQENAERVERSVRMNEEQKRNDHHIRELIAQKHDRMARKRVGEDQKSNDNMQIPPLPR